jgi:hypothetical protein
VLLRHGAAGAPSTTHYTLFTNSSKRYHLKLPGAHKWRTGMHIKVRGHRRAAANATGGTAPDLFVTEVVKVTTPPRTTGVGTRGSNVAATAAAGTAPAIMGVLYIIITMCEQPASITPEVRRYL